MELITYNDKHLINRGIHSNQSVTWDIAKTIKGPYVYFHRKLVQQIFLSLVDKKIPTLKKKKKTFSLKCRKFSLFHTLSYNTFKEKRIWVIEMK